MRKVLTNEQVKRYETDGIEFPFRVLTVQAAADYAEETIRLEQALGGKPKATETAQIHLNFRWAYDLVVNPKVLDAVEDVLGPNLIVWASSLFGKRPRDSGFVSWHQDGTYWNLGDSNICTAWVALTPSRKENGCMRVVPKTHKWNIVEHKDTFAANNLLSRGQEIAVEVKEEDALDVLLEPGEMSLHHVKIVHGSGPNPSDLRRIGMAIRYVSPDVAQKGERPKAVLARGNDAFGHYELVDPPTETDFNKALAAQQEMSRQYIQSLLK